MKNLLSIFLIISASLCYAQFNCDSIHFNSPSVSVDQPSNDDVWMKYTYDWNINPTIAYPYYYVTFNDTTEVVVRDEYIGTFLGQYDSISFPVVYKNPLLADGYSVTGNFEVHDPNATPTFLCEFPFTMTVSNQSASLENYLKIEVSVSPNPVKDFVAIRSKKAIQEVVIVNSLGQEVHRLVGNRTEEMKVDLAFLEAGFYCLLVRSEVGISSTSLLLE